MKFKVDLHLRGDQISYIFCSYYRKYGEWPKPRNGLYSAISVYLSEYGEPQQSKVDACANGAPRLMATANELTSKYFPYSFD